MPIRCSCTACAEGGLRLHIGDRIVFSGRIPGREMHALKFLGENAGLRIQGSVSSDTVLVVTNDSLDNSSTVQKASAKGIRVASPDQFKIQLGKMQKNGRYIHYLQNRSFNSLFLFGNKVYPIGLTPTEISKLEAILDSKGATLGQQIRTSLAAGIFNKGSARNGPCLILQSEGVPLYDIADLSGSTV